MHDGKLGSDIRCISPARGGVAAPFFLCSQLHTTPFHRHVTDAPTPIPTEGVWTGDIADLPNWDAMPRRNRRRRRRGHTPIWLKYALSIVVLAVLVTAAQVAYHAMRSDPRDARQFAQRQLTLSVMRPNERVIRMVSVWQRPAVDYFRATRGILALTDAPGDSAKPIGGRLIYLGLQPRDPLSPADAPPTFDEREWPVDTLVEMEPRRTFFWLARGISVSAPREARVSLALAGNQSADAQVLRRALDAKHAELRRVGWDRREQRRARARDSLVTLNRGRRPWYHTVRRGEALASVARMYNTTPEALRELNGIEGDRVRIGQTLTVKGWTRQPVPFPAGVTPEFEPPPPPAPPVVAAPAP